MLKPTACTALMTAAAVLVLGSVQPAQAGSHGWFRSVQGPRGRGYTAGRTVSRSPGSTTATRSVQTNSGHGFNQTRSTTYGDGSVNNTVTRTYDDGRTVSRTGSATRNGDGSVTTQASHTGVAGNTQSGWSTIYRTDDGVGRTRGFTTSNGRSATETGSVAFAPGEMTVNHSVVTGSGASASQSATYTRGE